MNNAPTPSPQEPEFPADAVEVGRVMGAWGVKGWIKVQPFADEPQALFASKRWFVRSPDVPGPQPAGGWPPLLRVSQAREHGDGVVAGIHDLDDRNAAEALRGARLFVSRSSFPTAGDGEYYWVDLIGLSVVNREGQALGTVSGLLETGAHCVLRIAPDTAEAAQPVSGGDGKVPLERMIPFVSAYVDNVDLPARRIVVDWGLDY